MTDVTFKNLTKTYSGRTTPILNDFSLDVKCGELVALLGPSGVGKSTLLKLVAGIERPDAGDIRFNGQSILPTPPNRREAVLMFQKAYLFPFLTVGENIAFGLKLKGLSVQERRNKVTEMLDLAGLPGIEKRRPDELSGGEQQRVALARSLIIRPKVLLLDEPFNSLDTQVRLSLQEAVRSIQRELGITTILVTHNLDEAMAMSDRMALLIGGKVAAFDQPDMLFQRPPCVESARFVGVTTFVDGEAGHGWLDSALGRLKIRDESKAGRGVFAIRPEYIRIYKDKKENALPGVVQGCVYRGEYMEYQLTLGGATTRARLPQSAEPFAHGESVFVQLPAEHLFEVAG
jgi:ABC-type Fe3+/spermidine/putrescine transport system ATPase subunit